MEPPHTPDSAEKIARETRWLAEVAAGGKPGERAMQSLLSAYQAKFLASLGTLRIAPELRREVAQEVWLVVMRKAAQFPPGATPSAWLWGILANERSDALRKWLRRSGREVSDSEDAISKDFTEAMAALGATTPETHRALDDLRRCVQRAFTAFKREQPTAAWLLYLRHVEDWDLATIAEYRQSSAHAATEFLSRARSKFAPLIKPCLALLPG